MKRQDDGNTTMHGWIRPLSMPSIRILPFERPVEKVDPADLLRDLCRDSEPEALDVIKQRYLRLSTSQLDIFVVPAESLILEKLVWPLKSAKQAFCMGDFIGCIALCGMVCEMAIVVIWDLAADLWDINDLEDKYKKIFAERKYERHGQAKRIKTYKSLVPFLMNLRRMPMMYDKLGTSTSTL